jgi:hypothetical protein
MKRHKVFKALTTIRRLRNRVAHHEIIIGRNLNEDFLLISKLLSWICPDTAKWVCTRSSFLDRYAARPQQLATSGSAENSSKDTASALKDSGQEKTL